MTEAEFSVKLQEATANTNMTDTQFIKVLQLIQAYTAEQVREARLDEIDRLTIEYGSYNDGCGCCASETIRAYFQRLR